MTLFSRLALAVLLAGVAAPDDAFAKDSTSTTQKAKKKKKKSTEPARPTGGRPINPDADKKSEPKKDDAPKADAPKADAPKADAARTDAAKTDAAKTDAAKTDTSPRTPTTPQAPKQAPAADGPQGAASTDRKAPGEPVAADTKAGRAPVGSVMNGKTSSRPAPTLSTTERVEVSKKQVDASQRKAVVARPRTDDTRVSSHSSSERRPYHTRDHRYGRPAPWHLRAHPHARHPAPAHLWYRPWYSHWWVHPYWRWQHAVWVVHFDWMVSPWEVGWAPPARAGWSWMPGHYEGPVWVPGHWVPTASARAWYGVNWVFVPGFWVGDAYVEGYWRRSDRTDGQWVWVDGHYLTDGSFVPGYWAPNREAPKGYVWEPGFWDGETWVEGFWRPESREGYGWVSSRYDKNGTFQAGYWEPTAGREGYVWVPGWFDGNEWHSGEWVTQADYDKADPDSYDPGEGAEDGWEDPAPKATEAAPAEGEEIPMAIPVDGVEGG